MTPARLREALRRLVARWRGRRCMGWVYKTGPDLDPRGICPVASCEHRPEPDADHTIEFVCVRCNAKPGRCARLDALWKPGLGTDAAWERKNSAAAHRVYWHHQEPTLQLYRPVACVDGRDDVPAMDQAEHGHHAGEEVHGAEHATGSGRKATNRKGRGPTRFPTIGRDAAALGVTRWHLWKVLTGERQSAALSRRYRDLKAGRG